MSVHRRLQFRLGRINQEAQQLMLVDRAAAQIRLLVRGERSWDECYEVPLIGEMGKHGWADLIRQIRRWRGECDNGNIFFLLRRQRRECSVNKEVSLRVRDERDSMPIRERGSDLCQKL